MARLVPERVQVGDPPVGEDEVDRTIADDLVGDVDVAAPSVPGFESHAGRHRASAPRAAYVTRWAPPT